MQSPKKPIKKTAKKNWLPRSILVHVGEVIQYAEENSAGKKLPIRSARVVGVMPTDSNVVNRITGLKAKGFRFYLMDEKTGKLFWTTTFPQTPIHEKKPVKKVVKKKTAKKKPVEQGIEGYRPINCPDMYSHHLD